MYRLCAFVASRSHDYSARTHQLRQGAVSVGSAVVRTEVSAQTDVYDAWLAHALSIIKHILYAVDDAGALRCDEAHQHDVGFRSHTVIIGGAVRTGGYSCHVSAVESVIGVQSGTLHILQRGVFCSVAVLLRSVATGGTLFPYAYDARFRVVVLKEVGMCILKSVVHDANHDALAGVVAEAFRGGMTSVHIGVSACRVHKEVNLAAGLNVLHAVYGCYGVYAGEGQRCRDDVTKDRADRHAVLAKFVHHLAVVHADKRRHGSVCGRIHSVLQRSLLFLCFPLVEHQACVGRDVLRRSLEGSSQDHCYEYFSFIHCFCCLFGYLIV